MTLAAEKLLDEFRSLPGRVERPQTFMEIAGYPHRENVCSKILAFFMDPEEPHGCGTLVLDALASAGDIIAAGEVIGGNISVEREVVTDKGRIDILITSDDHAILIENKIQAGVNNPFDDYTNYLDQIANGRAKHKFLLTLSPTNEGNKWGFTNLTHEEFVEQIRSLLGSYISNADTRYLTIFLDFLNTLENLRKGSRMDKEFVKFLAERSDEVEQLLTEADKFKKELRQKVQDLGVLIEMREHRNVKQWFWKGPTPLSDVLVHDIPAPQNMLVAINTIIDPQGWRIEIFLRRKGNSNRNTSDLRNLLQRLKIPFREGRRFVHPDHFAYEKSLDQISPVLQDLIDKLATYRGA